MAQPFRLLNRLGLGACVALLIPALAIFAWAWTTGARFNVASLGGDSPLPLSREAAFEAMMYTYLFVLFVGLPLFILWSVVCLVIAWLKRPSAHR